MQRGFDLPHRARRHGSIPIVSSAGVTDYHNASMVDPPGVVTGRYGTIGELFFVDEPFWPLNTTLYVRDFHGNDPLFVYYHLQRFDFTTFSVKSGVPGVNRNDLHAEAVALPVDIEEQRAIATALSDVDGLLDGLDRLIAKKRDLKQAAMQQLLTGEARLPGFQGEWDVKLLGDVAEIVMGQSPSSSNYNSSGMGLPLIQGNADIDNRKTIKRIFTTQITKRGKCGDVLMSVRAPVGEVARAVFDVCLGRGVCAIRCDSSFLYHSLVYLEPTWAKHSKGSTFDSVNSADVKALELPVPTSHTEQNAIAEVLTDMDEELAALEQRRDKTLALKQAMMQELLTGRTRLV
ncbi:MAG: restriction endonuclease subunit S [Cyanobacteriota bacterium]